MIPDRAPTSAPPGNIALVHAEAAYREAVRAAARAAAHIVGAGLRMTRRRVRELRRHRIPRLERALAHVGLALEQSEHEDAVRRRWAAQR